MVVCNVWVTVQPCLQCVLPFIMTQLVWAYVISLKQSIYCQPSPESIHPTKHSIKKQSTKKYCLWDQIWGCCKLAISTTVVTNRENIGLFTVIITQQNEVISKKHSKSLPPDAKEFIYMPFISSSNQKNEYNSLVEKCKNGVDMNHFSSHLCCMNEKLPEHHWFLMRCQIIMDLFKCLQVLVLQPLTVHSKPLIKGL